jgi:hypothetical protein
LIFEEKCESDAFIFWSGQVISIPGNLTGHVEVLVNTIQANEFLNDPPADWPILEFYDEDGI